MLHVKSLVVEAVKSNGFAVLNADDPLVVKAAERVKTRIIYFSRQEHNLILHKHIAEGGIAAYVKDGTLTLATGNGLIQSISVSQIPLTLGGRLPYNVENVLAAVCAAYSLNIPMADIERGLATFQGDELQNPGRFNLYNIRDYRVIIDYGHNPAGIRFVAEAVKRMGASRLVAVLGAPGDREDPALIQIGEIAGAAFDRIYIREDKDLRGRAPGETAALLMRGILKAVMEKERITVIRDEQEALEEAMRQGICGDLIVLFYESLEPIQRILKAAMEHTAKTAEVPLLLKA
jgi:cyanophycin synthetase